MCNIAGYAGEKRAAPVLIDMLLREEGFDAGYYSGISTIHDGKLYHAKLTGDASRLAALKNAADLPGCVGIIHGRTKSGGGDEWAHPFIAERRGEPYAAYAANGSSGCFTECRDRLFIPLTEELLRDGYVMRSRQKMPVGRYPVLSDGTSVHSSDATAQLLMRYLDRGENTAAAAQKALCDMPSEDVGVAISLSDPEKIAFARINQPMMVGFCEHGAYMATTAIAFPDDAKEPFALPALSYGFVGKDGVQISPFPDPPCTVAPITDSVRLRAYDLTVEMLKAGGVMFSDIRSAVKEKLFDGENYDCSPFSLVSYEVLRALIGEGRVKTDTVRLPGAEEGIDAPKAIMSLAK